MRNDYKLFSVFVLAGLAVVTGTGCLKDKLADDQQTIPDIKSSPSVLSIMGPFKASYNFNTTYAVSLIASTEDTTFDVAYVRLGADQPAGEDIKVQLELVPELLGYYNDTNHTHLVEPPANLYTLSDNLVVTIPKGSREGALKMTAVPKDLEGGEYGLGFRIKSVEPAGYLISGNLGNAVVPVGIRNIYDGIYDYKGYALRGGDAALTGNFSGKTMDLITAGPASVHSSRQPYWGDGSTLIAVDNLYLAVDPTTNKVTISSAGGAINAPGYDNRYDPAEKTFYISFTWGAGPASRLSTDTLIFARPRP